MFFSLKIFKELLLISFYIKKYLFPEINLQLSLGLLLIQLFSVLMLFDKMLESEKKCGWQRSKTTCDILILQSASVQ